MVWAFTQRKSNTILHLLECGLGTAKHAEDQGDGPGDIKLAARVSRISLRTNYAWAMGSLIGGR